MKDYIYILPDAMLQTCASRGHPSGEEMYRIEGIY